MLCIDRILPTRCMCRCISTYWCLYVYFDVLHSLHVYRLVYLTHFHFCTHIHAVVINCVCQIFIKETACLLVSVCLCVRHTFCQLAYMSDGPLNGFFTVYSLKDTDLRKDVPFGGIDDE